MLDAFKLKPYDLEPVFASWTYGPTFNGNPKKDLPVDEWLEKIKAGCEERKIPEEYWYKVAQHFMGPKAKARFVAKLPITYFVPSDDGHRLDELKAVITKVHGGKYRWSWKKFKVAMQNMGWGIDTAQKETIKVSKTTGSWWVRRKPSSDVVSTSDTQSTRSRSSSIRVKKSFEETTQPPVPTRSESSSQNHRKSNFWPLRKRSQDNDEERPPLPPKSNSDMVVATTRSKSPSPSRSTTSDSSDVSTVTTVTEAPIWLLNACTALEYITSEHPKAMSIISAILITAGSIPAIPAIASGAGGAVLASGAAHAIGAIAVGLGQALSITVKNQNHNQNQSDNQVQAPSTVR
ncbi:hypothetical protein DXG01_003247 [Tephrocybe rancida]|nr:hypothetical protein DXG01_003247 [Tephrocybe rancida]